MASKKSQQRSRVAMHASLLLTSILAGACFAQNSQSCAEVIRIANWNIEWLGSERTADDIKDNINPKPKNPEDLASYIKTGAPDVLSLNEISMEYRDSKGVGKNRILDATFDLLNKAGASWQYELFAKRDGSRAPRHQWTGLAWNSRKVTKVGETSVMSVPVDPVKEDAFKKRLTPVESDTVVLSRWPSAIKLSAGVGKSDFVVIPLHLKSNNGDPKELEGTQATPTSQAVTPTIRAYEWELLSQQIEIWRKEFTDDDIVLVGDVNTKSATEPVLQAMITSGYVDCNSQDSKTYIKGKFASPFDRIIIRSDQPETKESCTAANQNQPLGFRVVRPADWKAGATVAQFNKFLSDHQMVVAGLCVGRDDD
jgi:hypothetical protein